MARDLQTISMGSEVFVFYDRPSDRSVMWCELFTDTERKFFRERMTCQVATFPIRHMFVINVRVAPSLVARPDATPPRGCVLCMHAYRGGLTTSWAWAKMWLPLCKVGFACVSLDFPGFGMSTKSQERDCKMSFVEDHKVVSSVLEQVVSFTKCCVLAMGESCTTAVRMMKICPDYMAKSMVWYNPILRFDDIVPIVAPVQKDHQAVLEAKISQQVMVGEIILHQDRRIWAIFDDKASDEAKETYQILVLAKKSRNAVSVTTVGQRNACEVQAGANVPVRIFYPSRALKKAIVAFLTGDLMTPPEYFLEPGDGYDASITNTQTSDYDFLDGCADEAYMTATGNSWRPTTGAGRSLGSSRVTTPFFNRGGEAPASRDGNPPTMPMMPRFTVNQQRVSLFSNSDDMQTPSRGGLGGMMPPMAMSRVETPLVAGSRFTTSAATTLPRAGDAMPMASALARGTVNLTTSSSAPTLSMRPDQPGARALAPPGPPALLQLPSLERPNTSGAFLLSPHSSMLSPHSPLLSPNASTAATSQTTSVHNFVRRALARTPGDSRVDRTKLLTRQATREVQKLPGLDEAGELEMPVHVEKNLHQRIKEAEPDAQKLLDAFKTADLEPESSAILGNVFARRNAAMNLVWARGVARKAPKSFF